MTKLDSGLERRNPRPNNPIATTNEFKQFKNGASEDISTFSKEKDLEVRKDMEILGWSKNHGEIRVTEKEYPEEEMNF